MFLTEFVCLWNNIFKNQLIDKSIIVFILVFFFIFLFLFVYLKFGTVYIILIFFIMFVKIELKINHL
jgi:hypothetical protein